MSNLEEELSNAINLLQGKVQSLEEDIEELHKETQYVVAYVESLDIPDRSALCKVLSSTGLKTMVLRCWTDSLALELLNQYNEGRTRFVFRLHGGYISAILPNNKFPRKTVQLSQELNKPVITSSLSEEDEVARNNIHPSDTAGMKGAISRILYDWEHAKRR